VVCTEVSILKTPGNEGFCEILLQLTALWLIMHDGTPLNDAQIYHRAIEMLHVCCCRSQFVRNRFSKAESFGQYRLQ